MRSVRSLRELSRSGRELALYAESADNADLSLSDNGGPSAVSAGPPITEFPLLHSLAPHSPPTTEPPNPNAATT